MLTGLVLMLATVRAPDASARGAPPTRSVIATVESKSPDGSIEGTVAVAFPADGQIVRTVIQLRPDLYRILGAGDTIRVSYRIANPLIATHASFGRNYGGREGSRLLALVIVFVGSACFAGSLFRTGGAKELSSGVGAQRYATPIWLALGSILAIAIWLDIGKTYYAWDHGMRTSMRLAEGTIEAVDPNDAYGGVRVRYAFSVEDGERLIASMRWDWSNIDDIANFEIGKALTIAYVAGRPDMHTLAMIEERDRPLYWPIMAMCVALIGQSLFLLGFALLAMQQAWTREIGVEIPEQPDAVTVGPRRLHLALHDQPHPFGKR